MSESKINRLRTLSDELADIADDLYDDEKARPDDASARLRKASYNVQDAIAELMQVAGHQHGMTGPVQYRVLRERAA